MEGLSALVWCCRRHDQQVGFRHASGPNEGEGGEEDDMWGTSHLIYIFKEGGMGS